MPIRIPPRSDIEDQVANALDGVEEGTKYPGLSYEEGVIAALDWVCGLNSALPITDEEDDESMKPNNLSTKTISPLTERRGWIYESVRGKKQWRIEYLTPFGWHLWPVDGCVGIKGGVKGLFRSALDLDDESKWKRIL